MIIVRSIDYLSSYTGSFALLRTDDIACETQNKDGYNSSVILFRGDQLFLIYHSLVEIYQILTPIIFRFDYWLEMVFPKSDYIQDIFPGKVSDFLAKCEKAIDEESTIVIFPRKPKPHDYPSEWVKKYWVCEK